MKNGIDRRVLTPVLDNNLICSCRGLLKLLLLDRWHRLYYNCIKSHENLGGETLDGEAGITIECSNKWLTLMHNAIKYQKEKN